MWYWFYVVLVLPIHLFHKKLTVIISLAQLMIGQKSNWTLFLQLKYLIKIFYMRFYSNYFFLTFSLPRIQKPNIESFYIIQQLICQVVPPR